MKWIWKAVCLIQLFFLLEACENGSAEESVKEADQRPAVAGDIFHHQKQATYGDSLYIRVLSWGAKETGSYLVLVADSLNQHYIGDSFFRQGALKNIWVDDLDADGMPEVGVVLKQDRDLEYGRLSLHELSDDFTFKTAYFSPLSETLGADYGGGDSIYRRNDRMIVREFHLLDRLDTLSQSNRKRRVLYMLENNQLVVSGIEEL